MAEKWFRLTKIPDLTLNKYASLEGRGVDCVIEKHISFLRQLNRKGIVSGLSFHLYYLYIFPKDLIKDMPGHRLLIFFQIIGNENSISKAIALIKASPLADFYDFESTFQNNQGEVKECNIINTLKENNIDVPIFSSCSFLTKNETYLTTQNDNGQDLQYLILRDWEVNKDGRLYNMCNTMEALEQTSLYRVDLYPVEKIDFLRETLKRPISKLRKQQDEKGVANNKDYEGKDALKNYEDLIEKFDSSPHFQINIMAFANHAEDSITILDAAGAESVFKGKYNIGTFTSEFGFESFLDDKVIELKNKHEGMILKKDRDNSGLIICSEKTPFTLDYLSTLFTLEEVAPFFRFPALYDGETIQISKETAPDLVSKKDALNFGKDINGYDVYFPLKLLPKHAFVSGVPGSGKTNSMLHIASEMWKEYQIPFLVLEPAKQEYRAILNDPKMQDVYLFSPNADMSFPLHINPFEMPKGTRIAEHIRKLCEVFEGAFPLQNPMPFLLDTAIEAVYRDNGWIPDQIYTGEEKNNEGEKICKLPTMSQLYKRLEKELESTKYSTENKGNLESALKVRIGSLLRREMGEIFDVPQSTFPPEKWLEIPAIIELESMGTGPANFLTLMLCSLIRETLKVDPNRENGSINAVEKNGFFEFSSDFAENNDFSINLSVFELFLGNEERIINNSPSNNKSGIILTKSENFIFQVSGGNKQINLSRFNRFLEGEESLLYFSSKNNNSGIFFTKNNKFVIQTRDGDKQFGYFEYNKEKKSICLKKGKRDIRHVIFIEEAHNLIGSESEPKQSEDANPKQAATAFIIKMLAEVRALKEGIIIADQLPTAMAPEVLKNTGLKLGLRITSSDDRSLLGGTMAANKMQLEQMSTFLPGEALIFYEDLLRPFKMRFTEWCGRISGKAQKENLTKPKNDNELRNLLVSSNSKTYRYITKKSIWLICRKMIENINTRTEDFSSWLELIFPLDYYNDFQKARNKPLSPAEAHDLIEEDMEYRETIIKEIEKNNKKEELLDIFLTVKNNLIALERLTYERWNRSGVMDQKLVDYILYQRITLAENTLLFYNNIIRLKKHILVIDKIYKHIDSLQDEITKLARKNL